MSAVFNTLVHPGRPEVVRIQSIDGPALAIEFELQPGLCLRDALVGPLQAAGLDGATVRMENFTVRALHYVRPTLPQDDQHVAFYSEPHAIEAPVQIELAVATIGHKDGAPFVHCHALWRDAEGRERGGHLFNDQVVVAAPARARAWGLGNAAMRADHDVETNFTLFHPVPVPARPTTAEVAGRRTAIARIRPNEDLVRAIEAVCADHGFASATIRGSVGSTVGVRFDDGHVVDDIATEIMVLQGQVAPSAAGLRATLDIALIDPRGHVHKGRVTRGANPVLICFELVLEEGLEQGLER